ncbi:MAG TPA: hypothetical protein VMS99_15570 [Acidimicrobiia bacterium]|nr:hypothetical protein [Acidimicrobiia bacterium]
MNSGWHHRRLGPVMWGAIGITFMILAVVAVYQLDSRIVGYAVGYAVGALVLTCLAVCGSAFWLDSRTARTTERLVDQLRRPNH